MAGLYGRHYRKRGGGDQIREGRGRDTIGQASAMARKVCGGPGAVMVSGKEKGGGRVGRLG
jgi:hypothetical protein